MRGGGRDLAADAPVVRFTRLAAVGAVVVSAVGTTAALSSGRETQRLHRAYTVVRTTTGSRLLLGFFDGAFTGGSDTTWLSRARAAGSDVVRLAVPGVAPNGPKQPAGFDPRDPGSPGYNFGSVDAAVKAAAAHGLRVILEFTGVPTWAEGPHMPADATPGSWEPNPTYIRDFAMALGRRYSGTFPDPADPGHSLPRVWAFQLWNEPNLSLYLAPQWRGNKPEAPILYRNMLNAFYAGVKSVDPSAVVVTAGTAPFGDLQPGGERIPPAAFWRGVLCVAQIGTRLVGEHCRNPAHFDALAHHPYSVGDPDTAALNPDDVSIPDIGKLTAILRVAERNGTALPRIRHHIWVTEVGYNTKPPNPAGVPLNTAARWLAQTLWLLWSQGVSVITWNTIVDQPPIPNYSSTSQSGIYFGDGQPKRELVQAFSFPFVAIRKGRSTVELWGRPPAAGRLMVQRLASGAWKPVARVNVHTGFTFLTQVVDTAPTSFRAVIAGHTSLTSTVG
jgi:hypothetical protein